MKIGGPPGRATHTGKHRCFFAGNIEKEDHVLFEIADRRLPPSMKNDIQTEFDRIERDIVGEGRHAEYHQMLDSLAEKYR
jgi:hemerythrin-like domain-containing protein